MFFVIPISYDSDILGWYVADAKNKQMTKRTGSANDSREAPATRSCFMLSARNPPVELHSSPTSTRSESQ